jgi:hypothetical protein
MCAPLEQEARYGWALREGLLRMSQELRAAEDEELAALAPWQAPPLAKGSDDRAEQVGGIVTDASSTYAAGKKSTSSRLLGAVGRTYCVVHR